jgi:hypothetical protein
MSDWTFLNRHRVRSGRLGSDDSDGFNGAFDFSLRGEARRIFCVCSDGMGWKHISVSFGPNKSTPSWELMCRVKDLFFEPEDWVVQFHPPQSEYVNNHPGCLHLWQCTEDRQPTPLSAMVGLKALNPA